MKNYLNQATYRQWICKRVKLQLKKKLIEFESNKLFVRRRDYILTLVFAHIKCQSASDIELIES